MRKLEVRELGLVPYAEAWDLQKKLAEQRKQGEIPDQLLLLEHPHVLTLGRNGKMNNVLASPERLRALAIDLVEIDRGGDVTYHGPGQIVGYPILDLKEWKRDVVQYVRSLEEVIIRVLRRFGIEGHRDPGATGVWTSEGKICAIGVHISRWVTTHGFALNRDTDLRYFQHIVPCGLARPVTSMEKLGAGATSEQVHQAIVEEFARVYEYETALQCA